MKLVKLLFLSLTALLIVNISYASQCPRLALPGDRMQYECLEEFASPEDKFIVEVFQKVYPTQNREYFWFKGFYITHSGILPIHTDEDNQFITRALASRHTLYYNSGLNGSRAASCYSNGDILSINLHDTSHNGFRISGATIYQNIKTSPGEFTFVAVSSDNRWEKKFNCKRK